LGYRIEVAGRFTRKQRATYLLFKGGRVPLASILTKIDYSKQFVILKDGVGSIKVWLQQGKHFTEFALGYKS